jgi:hypothetical protein
MLKKLYLLKYMINNKRINKYYDLNTKLAFLDDDQINKYINKTKDNASGIINIIKLGNHKIFVKAIPLAKLYADNHFDTSNLYKLPVYYNYGFGSAGINPWRELLTHIKTTNWVLENTCSNFPLMYHYRIMKNSNNNFISFLDDRTMKRWSDNKQIKKYLTDRYKSEYKIVIFLEYIPHTFGTYINEYPKYVDSFYKKSNNIISFLNKNNIIHCDAHSFNYLVDDEENLYLTDFGLCLDKSFYLTKDEIKFFNMNKSIDKYYAIDNIYSAYFNRIYHDTKIRKKLHLDQIGEYLDIVQKLFDNIDLYSKEIKITKSHIRFIKKNQKFILDFIIWSQKFMKATNKNKYMYFKK